MALQDLDHETTMSTGTDEAVGASTAEQPGNGRSLHTGAPLGAVVESRVEAENPGTEELFRGIYTRAGLGFVNEVIAIASAISGEGKTTIGLGLAVTIAQDFPDKRVVLVETDLHKPVLAADFGVDASPGLLDCVIDSEPVQNALRPTFLENMHLMPVGALLKRYGRPLRSV
jgi:Mrp family chromosome partitioning ATPase